MMKKHVSILLGILLLLTLLVAYVASQNTSEAAEKKEKVIIKMIDSGSGSSTWAWYTAHAFLTERHSPWLRVEVLPSKGYAEALYFLLTGKGEVASTDPLFVSKARKGIEEYKSLGPRKGVRLISNLAELYDHIIVLDNSDIKAFTFDEIKGKRVVTRQFGSITAYTAWAYLKAIGIDPEKDVKMLYMNASDSVRAVLDGTADVFMAKGGIPYPHFEEMFVTKPCRLLSIPAEGVRKANKMFELGLTPKNLPANTYKGQTTPIPTGSTFSVTVCLDTLDEDIAYELTKMWWEYMDERDKIGAVIAKHATVDNLKDVAESSGIEFHKGTLKYYREKGWIK